MAVSKLYKRKSKKTRNSAIQAPNARKKKIREATILVRQRSGNQEDQDGYASEESSAFEEEEEEEEGKEE